MDAHGDVPGAAVDDELHVDTRRVDLGGAERGRVEQLSGVVQAVDERDGVRVPHVDVAGGPGALADRHGDLLLGEDGAAHGDRHVAALVEVHPLDAAAGGDGEVAGLDVAGVLEVAGEDADAVAAHLGDGAVAVAVVHEPLGLVGQVRRLGVRGGPDDVQHPVRADAGAPVAELRDGGRGQLDGVVRVRDDHEVVLGAVALEEGEARLRHPPMVPSGAFGQVGGVRAGLSDRR